MLQRMLLPFYNTEFCQHFYVVFMTICHNSLNISLALDVKYNRRDFSRKQCKTFVDNLWDITRT